MLTPSCVSVPLQRLAIQLESDERRVIALPFSFAIEHRANAAKQYATALPDRGVQDALDRILAAFQGRHENIEAVFEEHYQAAAATHHWQDDLPRPHRLLIGAYLTLEYAIESAALFNPSIVPHPNQDGVPQGDVRFVMSLRATGEGHLSSIVFCTGVITHDDQFLIDPPSPYSARARLAPDQFYLKPLFRRSLAEMAVPLRTVDRVLQTLPERFTLVQLDDAIRQEREQAMTSGQSLAAFDAMLWLARSNYQLQMAPDSDVTDIVIFPQNDNESRGCEDLRLVRFVDDDRTVTYFGTYTAHNEHRTLPMLLQTRDFRQIGIHTLNGRCAQNKGMALFPRRIQGHYCMCSRIDGQNLYIMYSDYVHFWEDADLLAEPQYPWELMLIGNCGSPLETPEGWLLLTHGVGPMRSYCIGAMLLDLEDPLHIRGRLREPLLCPTEEEREGYVPNVVYSCGAMVHSGRLYLPYAISDKATRVATLPVDALLDQLLHDGP